MAGHAQVLCSANTGEVHQPTRRTVWFRATLSHHPNQGTVAANQLNLPQRFREGRCVARHDDVAYKLNRWIPVSQFQMLNLLAQLCPSDLRHCNIFTNNP
jgi:hypothetical protein